MKKYTLFLGLLHRRECLIPTWRGLFLFAFVGVILLVVLGSKVHSFLAVTNPVSSDVLVVEGWVPDYVLQEAMVEFKRNHYRKVYVTGGTLDVGGHLSDYKTFADLGAATLVKMGMNKSLVEAVPSSVVRKDRTYASALALKDFLSQQSSHVTEINLLTEGAHAKRSQILFQQAFGDSARVGIIAIASRDYDPQYWWKFSGGVRAVVDEFIAYIYVLVVFPFTSLH